MALVAGVFFRWWDLGGAPLAVDEYYLGTSILNTAQRGLPEFACGRLYIRGVLMQYLSVPLIKLGMSLEFSVRFWAAITSIVAIFAVWRIGRLAGGYLAASIAVGLMSLSLWEVEFARLGRMYAPFQAIFLWYVYFQIQQLVIGRRSAGWWCLALSAVAIPTYEGAVFILALNFMPLIWPGRGWTRAQLAVAFGILFSALAYLAPKVGSNLTADNVLAVVARTLSRMPVERPPLPAFTAPILLTGLTVLGYVLWRFRRGIRLDPGSACYWGLVALCVSFGFIGFGATLLICGLLLRLPLPLKDAAASWRQILTSMAVLAAIWAVVVFSSFWLSGTGLTASASKALRYTLDYPDVYSKIVRPWLAAIPATTMLLAALVLLGAKSQLAPERQLVTGAGDVVRYLSATLILLCLLVGLLWQPYKITRYTFFLYPLVLLLASLGIIDLARRLGSTQRTRLALIAASITALFVVTEDFGLRHLAKINDTEFRYRTAYTRRLADHYYSRRDFRGAAYHVNQRLHPKDKIVAFDLPLPHYLDRTSGIFIRDGTPIHSLVSSCGGTRDRWSNAPLIDGDEELFRLIGESDGDVWLIMRTAAYRSRDPLESSLVEQFRLTAEFTSQDGQLAVYRLSPSVIHR
jgi:hypothetical protein